jgi:hypothetical protein
MRAIMDDSARAYLDNPDTLGREPRVRNF